MKCWITAHWPVQKSDEEATSHVYVQAHHKSVPSRDDIVLIYQCKTAIVSTADGQKTQVKEPYRCHRGKRKLVRIPDGVSRIIAQVTVNGEPRPITETDVVYDFGNLAKFEIIPCKDRKLARKLELPDLMNTLEKPDAGQQFFHLWRVPDRIVPKLLAHLGL